jgi:hypothetical protein
MIGILAGGYRFKTNFHRNRGSSEQGRPGENSKFPRLFAMSVTLFMRKIKEERMSRIQNGMVTPFILDSGRKECTSSCLGTRIRAGTPLVAFATLTGNHLTNHFSRRWKGSGMIGQNSYCGPCEFCLACVSQFMTKRHAHSSVGH